MGEGVCFGGAVRSGGRAVDHVAVVLREVQQARLVLHQAGRQGRSRRGDGGRGLCMGRVRSEGEK